MHQNTQDSHLDLLSIKVPGSFWKLTCPQVGRCEPGFALMQELGGLFSFVGPLADQNPASGA